MFFVSVLACDPTQHADLAAVVMQEGLANVCLITPSMTLVRAKIETNIPRKRKGSCSQHDKVSSAKVLLSEMLVELNHILVKDDGFSFRKGDF